MCGTKIMLYRIPGSAVIFTAILSVVRITSFPMAGETKGYPLVYSANSTFTNTSDFPERSKREHDLHSSLRLIPSLDISRENVRNTYEVVRKSSKIKRRLPSAIIIGVKKGGTRALLEFLRVHPDIRAPGREIHFFDRHYSRGLKWYRRQMPRSMEKQITIEKTPCYFVTDTAPERVSAMSKATKLIVVVRDPVTRLISDYAQTAAKFPSTKSFARLAILDNDTKAIDTSWSAVRIGMYSEHLKRWLRFFPLEQILFVSGERLIYDPAVELDRAQDFLGIKRIVTSEHFFFDDAKGFPCLKKHEGSGRPKCLGKSKGRRHPKIGRGIENNLRTFYRPFNAELTRIIGMDMGWS